MVIPPAKLEMGIHRHCISSPVRMAGSAWKIIFNLFLIFTLLCPAHADVKKKTNEKKKTEPYAPEVRNISASFAAGQSVDIELAASVGTLKQVEFLIRQAPQNGTLSAVRPHPRDTNKSIVTYTHRDLNAPLTDRFTFASRVDGGPMSAPGTVTLTGRGFEPRLEILDVSTANKVFPGGESSIRFSLKNGGDAPFARDMKWEAPWRGPPQIELKAGEKADFMIVFKPAQIGIFRSSVEIQPGTESSKLLLYGECVRAITVSPGRLMLTVNPQTGAREGTLNLVNGRSETMHVNVRTPDRLEGGGTFDVSGASKTNVILRLPMTDVNAFRGDVIVSTSEGSETITAEADAKGQELRIAAPANGRLDFGNIEQGATACGEIQLHNSGGMPAIVEAQAFPPLIVTPAHQTLRVGPGTSITFAVSFKAVQTGPFKSEVRIAGAGSVIRVPVEVNVIPSKSPPITETKSPSTVANQSKPPDQTPANNATPPEGLTPLQQTVMGYLRSRGLPMPIDKINPYLERVNNVRVLDRSTSSISIAWKKPEINPAKWEVEASVVTYEPESNTFLKLWKTFKTWEPIPTDSDKAGIRLHTLPEASQIEIRIMGVDRDGKFSEPSLPIMLATLSAWAIPAWFWYLLIVVILMTTIYYLIRIRRGDFEK